MSEGDCVRAASWGCRGDGSGAASVRLSGSCRTRSGGGCHEVVGCGGGCHEVVGCEGAVAEVVMGGGCHEVMGCEDALKAVLGGVGAGHEDGIPCVQLAPVYGWPCTRRPTAGRRCSPIFSFF